MKRPAFLLGSDVPLKCKGHTDFGTGKASKMPCEGLTGGGEVFAGQVHLEVNCPLPSESGLVIKPTISGNNDVMTVVLGTESNALRFDLEAVPLEQVAQRNLTDLVGNLLKVHRVTVTFAGLGGGC
jgi:hypothetical protein